LITAKIGVSEIPILGVRVRAQDTLLEVWDFMKAVHVELTDKGAEALVFEPVA
jgi:hypothetical protein